MTDTEVIETLERFLGPDCNNWFADGCGEHNKPGFLTSIDALRPVLEKLARYEWWKLYSLVDKLYCDDDSFDATGAENLRFLLTLPPATLTRAIAEVIKETK